MTSSRKEILFAGNEVAKRRMFVSDGWMDGWMDGFLGREGLTFGLMTSRGKERKEVDQCREFLIGGFYGRWRRLWHYHAVES